MRRIAIPLALLATAAWAQEFRRVSPHHAESAYDASDPSCGACHTRTPARGAAPSEAGLISDSAESCGVCHPAAPHRGVAEHMGQSVPERVRAALPPTIALAEGGAVACWSCHEVHAGVPAGKLRSSKLSRAIAEQLDAPEDAAWPGAPRAQHAMLALPLEEGELCRACHEEGP